MTACADTRSGAATSDRDSIAALEHRVEEATRLGDVAFLDSIYAPTFRFKHGTGELEERAQRLAALRQSTTEVLARDLDSLDVEVHDDVALTTGRIHVRQQDEDPQWREYTVRYARIYVRRNGRWRLLTHHTTGLTHGPLIT
ncbi:MAG TPA: nuclear transport factor 2 family protein [Chloroflexota bacterium]|nr:nuclear transport factor 2 family protein [Chloroflexota bacterium]